ALQREIRADAEGYLARLDALTIAHACALLGAGRQRKGDPIDLAAGVVVSAKVGDRVRQGQTLLVAHANDEGQLAAAERALREAIVIASSPIHAPPLILERLLPPAARPAA
ncbi:MAG TPA: pyrimidine-nucleoside phosphorylase, partial [Chloroflexota bacterium]